jgi:BASS family bile acid:Na+ symporter
MPLYCLMILFFLSYLPIKMDVFLANIASSVKSIATLSFLKLVLLPVAVFYLVHWSLPNYAAAAFLLAAISTGVTAPFIAGLVGANSGLVLSVVVATSLLVPFTMPVLTKILLSRSSGISLGEMVKTLVLIVFIPVLFAELVRKKSPGFVAGIMKAQYPVSVVLFALINLGAFSRYGAFFYQDPSVLLVAALFAVFLALVFSLAGALVMRGRPLEDQLAGAAIFGNINNVMILVFASHFFGPIETTVAAMYNIPYFGLIIPMRIYRGWRLRRTESDHGPGARP